ncbi:MAG: putative inorganic carbon transporter subunit DabA, partial [Marinobacter sp.]|nr:putative inorganic carbon transporter subunit DabA [Marinobacter sp.]
VRDSLNRNRTSPSRPDPEHSGLFHCHGGDPISDIERVDLAEQLLRGMSLTTGFASLLVFVGHGSHTDNNPQQAGLACGACGGQNGGVNASLAASLINNPRVRTGLAERGIRIPDFTLAVAAEHCTVTDRVTILDKDRVPDSYLARLLTLENGFAEAAKRTRRERAAALKLTGRDDEALLQSMIRRTVNWAEPRPEWGLANNASIVFAQRARTRGLDLEGRSFLHDYDPELDPEGKILTALMTAPMVVANWINLQYLGSVAAPDTYGAGNKLLHSVVGGNIGLIEGNDPDLRIGLSYQSVHDGDHWRHEPVRLTVVIDAPRGRIEQVIASQPDVARLVENRWLWLWRFADTGLETYHNGQWQRVVSLPEQAAEAN